MSVNPHKPMHCYSSEIIKEYYDKGFASMPPHIYGPAQLSYTNLAVHKHNQSVIISGESGAGKTEAG